MCSCPPIILALIFDCIISNKNKKNTTILNNLFLEVKNKPTNLVNKCLIQMIETWKFCNYGQNSNIII